MKSIILASAVALSAGSASAAIIEHTLPFNLGIPGSQTLMVPAFDLSLGTLTRVTLSVDAAIRARVTAENRSTQPNEYTARISGTVTADGPGDLDTNATMAFLSPSLPVAPADGVAGSGPDFANFGTLSANGANATDINGGFESFTGDNLPVTVTSVGQFRVTGLGNSLIRIGDFRAEGTVIVTYEYTPIPTPGALALLGLGGMATLRRRR